MKDIVIEAFWLWRRAYEVETQVTEVGAIKAARRALLLTVANVAEKMQTTESIVRNLEIKEAQGKATLQAMAKIAEAMDCDFVYAVIPKIPNPESDKRLFSNFLMGLEPEAKPYGKDFSEVMWEKILPHAMKEPVFTSADEKQKARALAAAAKELLMSPEFRRSQNWTARKA